jgi:large subunit ribosomal protein L25
MKQITLITKPRNDLGRTASKHLRENGVIPAVIYGEHGSRNLALDAHEFKMAYRKFSGSAALLELKSEGEDEAMYAIIQELQRNPRNDAFVHIDFKEIVRGKDMEVDIPVHTKGIADGVRNYGGVLEVSMHTLRVRCRPRDLPEFIEIDVTALEIGKSIHLEEITAPEGVTFLDDPEQVVVGCVGASAGASGLTEEEEEAAAEEAAAAEAEGEAEEDSKESSESDSDSEEK